MATDLDLINALRLRPGDTILLRYGSEKVWVEYKRTLLWHGEKVAVWSAASRRSSTLKWSKPIETANPALAHSTTHSTIPSGVKIVVWRNSMGTAAELAQTGEIYFFQY